MNTDLSKSRTTPRKRKRVEYPTATENKCIQTQIISRRERKIAPNLEEYLAPGGITIYKPRKEWCCQGTEPQDKCEKCSNKVIASSSKDKERIKTFKCSELEEKLNVTLSLRSLGNSALHKAILGFNTPAVLDLLAYGAPTNVISVHKRFKGVSPLISASHQGNLTIVESLLQHDACPHLRNKSGSTALIQASHHGHVSVVKILMKYGANVDQYNDKKTTALMRASQEGHKTLVNVLIQHGANVNAQNQERMTPLLLAAQRGNSDVTRLLLMAGADVNQRTKKNLTCLMLACKKGHIRVVKTLLAHGAEIEAKDHKGRKARDIIDRLIKYLERDYRLKKNEELSSRRRALEYIQNKLSIHEQISLMKENARSERNFIFAKIHTLIQKQRVRIFVKKGCKSIQINSLDYFKEITPQNIKKYTISSSDQALLLTMTLPAQIMEHIALFVPLSPLYSTRIRYLQDKMERRSTEVYSGHDIIPSACDLMEEMLEEGGFLEICDNLEIPPPCGFESWTNWSSWGRISDGIIMTSLQNINSKDRLNENENLNSLLHGRRIQATKDMRKMYPFFCTLSDMKYSPMLRSAITAPPYHMRDDLFNNLKKYSDVVKLIRNPVIGCHFDMNVAKEIVVLGKQVFVWLKKLRQNPDLM